MSKIIVFFVIFLFIVLIVYFLYITRNIDCVGVWNRSTVCEGVCEGIDNQVKGIRKTIFEITTPVQNNGRQCIKSNGETIEYLCKKTDCPRITKIFAGYKNSYFMRIRIKEIFGVGNNNLNEITGTNTDNILIPKIIDISNNIQANYIIQVATGENHTLFLLNDMTVLTCGFNNYGQLGIDYKDEKIINKNELIKVKGIDNSNNITDIIQISAGNSHSLFLKRDGTVFCCGLNTNGQLGLGHNSNTYELKQILDAKDIKSISAGSYHSLFLKNDGTVFACGLNYDGQLGVGDKIDRNTLTQVLYNNGNISDISEISAGGKHSLFLRKNDGVVFSCGNNDLGQLGIGNIPFSTSLIQVKNINGIENISDITKISAGSLHSLFLKKDYKVLACGNNEFGQLGIGDTTFEKLLVKVKGINGTGNISDIIEISAGNKHSLFLKVDGTIFSCGNNEFGQLGIGDTTKKNTLVQINNL